MRSVSPAAERVALDRSRSPIAPGVLTAAYPGVVVVPCDRWHVHGVGFGHRIARHRDESPYADTGYRLAKLDIIERATANDWP